ncbi:MAG: diacylglycerol/lipid kinase family protein [Acidimicrobiia bacterium]
MAETRRPTASRRIAAISALVAYLATFGAILVLLYNDFPALVGTWVVALVAVVAGYYAVTRLRVVRLVATLLTIAMMVLAALILLRNRTVVELVVVVVLAVLGTVLARYSFSADKRALREGPPPGVRAPAGHHPVLLMNPTSGGGKVERFNLVEESRARGIEAVVLGPGDDLEELARAAVARGADVIGMAGGDGSQALVSGIAAEHDLPYVCVPAGTRNHLALDLGVDRDDVVGALDAFADGYERHVDLARCAGRVFVNNVSLGVYARIVQSDAYRDDKLGTTAEMIPELLGPGSTAFDLQYTGPGGNQHEEADLMLISNNRYQLDRLGGFGSRARMDSGKLGIVVVKVRSAADVAELVAAQTAGTVSRYRGWREWEADTFEVRSGEPIEAGVDGEALRFESPLRFEIVPGALRVRVAPHHPGYSPAALAESVRRGGIRRLVGVAVGRDPGGIVLPDKEEEPS